MCVPKLGFHSEEIEEGIPYIAGNTLWAVYQFIVVIVLLSILRARMVNTYHRIFKEADVQWKYFRFEIHHNKHISQGKHELLQGVSSVSRTGLGRHGFMVLHCLPNSAWADSNLVEATGCSLARHHGGTKSIQPSSQSR